jgi:lysophospholipase L1-like esterase
MFFFSLCDPLPPNGFHRCPICFRESPLPEPFYGNPSCTFTLLCIFISLRAPFKKLSLNCIVELSFSCAKMWDSLLIHMAIHPFSFTILPILLAFGIAWLGKTRTLRIFAALLLMLGTTLFFLLHFRWDSYSIHFDMMGVSPSSTDNILFVGDSITHEGNRPRGFITKLRSIQDIDYKVLAERGANSQQISSMVDNYSQTAAPRLIIAQSGINDLLEGRTEQETMKSQVGLINRIKNRYPNTPVWFLPIHPISHNNKILEPRIASAQHSLERWWKDPLIFTKNHLLDDGVHLNARGHTELARMIAEELLKI